MLDRMRNWGRSTGVKVLFGLLIVVFAFWGVGAGLAARVKPVATVNGRRIFANDIDQEAERLRRSLSQIYGANADAVLRNVNLRQEALNQIVEQRLIADEARHVGVRISDESLANSIAADPKFQQDGAFSAERYEETLQQNDLLPADYETMMRGSLMQDALRDMVEQGVQISDGEARHAFDLHNEKVSLAYLVVPSSDFVGKISPTDKQIQDYFNEHKDDFREPERIKISYLEYDPTVLAAKYAPTDKDIQDYYNSNLKKLYNHPDEVHARHILIEVPSGATDAQKATAKAKAEAILKQAQGGADFAKLAKDNSQDPATKLDGGDLGSFGRGQMIKPFEDAAFSMKPGEVRLVETRFGFHIVKLDSFTPAHTDKLEGVRAKIADALRNQTGSRMGRQDLDEDVSAALAGTSLDDIAKKRGIEVINTPMFSQADAGAVVHNPKLVEAAFKLDVNQVRAIGGAKDAAPYLVKLTGREPAHVPPFKDIEARVRDACIKDMAEALARAKAQDLLKQLKSDGEFEKVAQANNLTIHRAESFLRSSENVPGIGSFPEVADAAGVVPKVTGIIDRVMENKGDAYVFEVTERTLPSDEDWQSAQSDFVSEYQERQRAEAWQRFIEGLKARAKITVDASQFAQGAGGGPSDNL